MNRFLIAVTLAVFMSVLMLSFAFAGCGGCATACGMGGGKAFAGDGVVNDTCPVMGGEVSKDTPHQATYRGKKVGFCCAGCVTAFEADPEKYSGSIDGIASEKQVS